MATGSIRLAATEGGILRLVLAKILSPAGERVTTFYTGDRRSGDVSRTESRLRKGGREGKMICSIDGPRKILTTGLPPRRGRWRVGGPLPEHPMRVRTAACLAVFLCFMSGCLSGERRPGDVVEVSDEPPPSASACAAAGGRLDRQGMLGREMCVIPYADAGKVCKDGDECLGDCWMSDPQRGGFCQPDTSPFGCYSRLEKGRDLGRVCVD